MFTELGSPRRLLTACGMALALAACSTPEHVHGGQAGHRHAAMHHTPAGAATMGHGGVSGTASGTGTTSGPAAMDMGRMCTLHRALRNAPPEQRQQLLEQHMKGMSPEMRQRHMDMMGQHCD